MIKLTPIPYDINPEVLIVQAIEKAAAYKKDIPTIAYVLAPFHDYIQNMKEQIIILRQDAKISTQLKSLARKRKKVDDGVLQIAELIEKLREKE
jgi:hypothetical protein